MNRQREGWMDGEKDDLVDECMPITIRDERDGMRTGTVG